MLGKYTEFRVSVPLIFSFLYFSVLTEVPIIIYAFSNVPFITEIDIILSSICFISPFFIICISI